MKTSFSAVFKAQRGHRSAAENPRREQDSLHKQFIFPCSNQFNTTQSSISSTGQPTICHHLQKRERRFHLGERCCQAGVCLCGMSPSLFDFCALITFLFITTTLQVIGLFAQENFIALAQLNGGPRYASFKQLYLRRFCQEQTNETISTAPDYRFFQSTSRRSFKHNKTRNVGYRVPVFSGQRIPKIFNNLRSQFM